MVYLDFSVSQGQNFSFTNQLSSNYNILQVKGKRTLLLSKPKQNIQSFWIFIRFVIAVYFVVLQIIIDLIIKMMSSRVGGQGNIDELYQIQVKFDRSNATYKPDQTVSGFVSLLSKSGGTFKIDIESALISINGSASIQNRQNKLQIQEIIKRVPPLRIINIKDMVLAKSKTLTNQIKLPFRFKLQKAEHKFLQSYIGVFISISYSVNTVIIFNDRRMIQNQTPFYLQVPKQGRQCIDHFVYPKKKNFMVVSDDIKGDKSKIPNFKIKGELDSQICFFTDDLSGTITVDIADTPIRSIDLQMLRVEKVESDFKSLNQKTEIQLIQVCDGNVTRNLEIPLYMILPRYYSCPSVKYLWCSVNFQINLQIIFKDGYKVSVNIPLKLVRS